jgi:Outer membrane protein beta-barrel domain
MNKAAAVSTVVLLLGTGAAASAKGWEVSILGGWTAPAVQQQVSFSPDIELPNIPGTSIRQDGVFDLTAVGSFAFGGSVSYFFTEHVALEGRVDTINFDIDTVGPRFEAQAQVVPGLPSATVVLDAGMGTVKVERLFPLSLNLKARTGGRARFVASGGLSYLPHVRFEAYQPVNLGIGGFGIPPVDLVSVVLQAGAVDSGNSRWGFNGGAGVEIQVSPAVAVVGDFRVHSFQTQTFVWQPSQIPSSAIGEILVEQLEMLPPVEVELTYFQVTGGVSFRF